MSRVRHRRFWPLIVAAAICLQASAQSPGPASGSEALASQAESARASGNLPLATQLYEQALAADPHWVQGWWFLGNLRYQQNQYAAARDALSQYISASPKAVAALALRGLCEYELGSYPESLADIEAAIAEGAANQPRNAQILLYHEALLLTRLGRFEEAITKYTEFAKQGIVNDDIALGLGLAGLRIAELPSAIPPADLQLAFQSGKAALQLVGGDVAGGRRAFNALAAAFPTRPNLHYFCAYLLLTVDPDQGIEELRQELAVAPANKPAVTLLAWTLELRGDYVEALPVAQQAVKLDPGLTTNQLVLGRALLEANDVQGARTHLDQVVTADPQNLEAHISMAKAYSLLGRRDDARNERLLCLKLADTGKAHAP